MPVAYILTGGNLDNPQQQLQLAAQAVEQQNIGIVVKKSSLYQTAAWGRLDQPDFLNQVLQLETKLTAQELLEKLLQIELQMGRQRFQKNDPRVIDMDILFYDDAVIQEPNLTVPHPLLHLRRFVLTPLAEIAPTLLHPLLQKTIVQLLAECPDPLYVNKFSEAG